MYNLVFILKIIVFYAPPPSPIPVYHDNLEIEEEATESSNIGSLVCHVVAGDGNCLFRAISHQFFGDASRHEEIRLSAVAFIEANQAIFGNSVDCGWSAYLKKMQQLKEWGGE